MDEEEWRVVPDWMAKLTEDKVREIKPKRGVVTAKKVGAEFGVSESTVLLIWQGKTWQHVT